MRIGYIFLDVGFYIGVFRVYKSDMFVVGSAMFLRLDHILTL